MLALAAVICSSASVTWSLAAGCASAPTSRALRAAASASASGCLGSGQDVEHPQARGATPSIQTSFLCNIFLFLMAARSPHTWLGSEHDEWIARQHVPGDARARPPKRDCIDVSP